MPLYINSTEFIDSMWTFGGGNSTTTKSFSFCKGIVANKGTTDRDFNMPIAVRCVNDIICVLDSGNNRIKILNKNGQFLRHINHNGLHDTSCTALATVLQHDMTKFNMLTINWRTRILSDYAVNFTSNKSIDIDDTKSELKEFDLMGPFQEPIGMIETSNPLLFVIQDKKKLHLCLRTGQVVCESLEVFIS